MSSATAGRWRERSKQAGTEPAPARAREKRHDPGVREVAWAVKDRVSRHRLGIVAAGVAFYGLLAIFPALAALISIYGLLADPSQIAQQISSLSGVLPEQALALLQQQVEGLTQSDQGALGFGVLVGILLALWSASAGVKALMEALNVAYEEDEQRGFVKRAAVGLMLTLGAILVVVLAIALVVVLPAALKLVGLGSTLEAALAYARWPILALAAIFALGMLYRYGPSRERPRWTWLNRGAVFATVLWLIGSALFSWYVSSFGNYNETYGAVAGIVILLLWFLVSAYAILLGAEVNAERQRPAARS